MSWMFNPCCPCCKEKNIFSVKKFNADGELWRWQGSKPIVFNPDIQSCCWSGDDLVCVMGNGERPLLKFADGRKKYEANILSGIAAHQEGSGEPGCLVQDKAIVTIDNGAYISLRDFDGNLIVQNFMNGYSVQRNFYNHQCMWSQTNGTTNVKAWNGDGTLICDTNIGISRQVASVSGGILFVTGDYAIRLSDNATLPFIASTHDTFYGFENDKVLQGNTIYDHAQNVIGSFAPYLFGGYSTQWRTTNKYGYFFDGEFFGMTYLNTSVTADRVVGVGWFDNLGNNTKLIDGLDFSDWLNPWSSRIPCDVRITPNGKRYVIGISWDDDNKARPGVTLFDENRELIYSHPYITPDEEFNANGTTVYTSNFRGVTVDNDDNCYMTSTRFNFP